LPLFVGSRVLGFAISANSADVGDAYRVSVVPEAVCSDVGFVSSDFDRSVESDEVVVADGFESALTVPEGYVFLR